MLPIWAFEPHRSSTCTESAEEPFFERQVMGSEKPMHRAQPDGDAADRKRAADLL
jgi:hypothetical protein